MKKSFLTIPLIVLCTTVGAYEVAGFSIGQNVDHVQTDLTKSRSSKRSTVYQDFSGSEPALNENFVTVELNHGAHNRLIERIAFHQEIANLKCEALKERLESKYQATLTDTGYQELVYKNINSIDEQNQWVDGVIPERIKIKCTDVAGMAKLDISVSSEAQRKANRTADVAAVQAGQPEGSASEAKF